jgi:regulatory protein
MANPNQPFDLSDDVFDASSDDSPAVARAPAPALGRAQRGARARPSLKMQAIGYLSRREHSRQELRKKLLASLRQRAREDAVLAAACEAAARELAQALSEQASNGIDDAFAPPPAPNPASNRMKAGARAPARAMARASERAPAPPHAGVGTPPSAAAIAHLRLASGSAIPARLRAELALLADRVAAEPGEEATDAVLASSDAPAADPELEQQDPEAAVDRLLDWLVANKYLSETRFVESRVNARARKQGAMMIKHELARHGLALEHEQAATLRETEFARAQALWQRKFGEVASEPRLRARQARFLASRGFAADVVRRIVGGEEEY